MTKQVLAAPVQAGPLALGKSGPNAIGYWEIPRTWDDVPEQPPIHLAINEWINRNSESVDVPSPNGWPEPLLTGQRRSDEVDGGNLTGLLVIGANGATCSQVGARPRCVLAPRSVAGPTIATLRFAQCGAACRLAALDPSGQRGTAQTGERSSFAVQLLGRYCTEEGSSQVCDDPRSSDCRWITVHHCTASHELSCHHSLKRASVRFYHPDNLLRPLDVSAFALPPGGNAQPGTPRVFAAPTPIEWRSEGE